MSDAEYFVEKAEQCFRLALLAKTAGDIGVDVADNLEIMGNEFMNKAIKIETDRQRMKKA
jgi:hypothetical protein